MIVNRLGITGDVPAAWSSPADEPVPRERWLTLAVQPVPLTGLETWGASLHAVALAPRQRRIAQLAVSRRSTYDFAMVSEAALRAGLSPAEIQAVADEDWTAACWSDAERILLRFALMFDGGHGVGDAVVEQLRAHYDDAQIIGLCMVCAHGGALARTSIALRIEQLEGANR